MTNQDEARESTGPATGGAAAVPRIGVALGGGGVRGLAHILVFEALDELGCRPSVIAGTSMGAIIGAIYAGGMRGRDIRELVAKRLASRSEKWRDIYARRSDVLRWARALLPEKSRGGIVNIDSLIEALLDEVGVSTFEKLEIPLLVVAADFWQECEFVFERGDLHPALRASAAVPGVFAPVSVEGRVLVDGGVVNLVPYDLIMDRCDLTVGVHVGQTRCPGSHEVPSVFESLLASVDIMQSATLAEKMRRIQPDIYLYPEIRDVGILDFGRSDEVLRQAAPAVENFKKQLATRIAEWRAGGAESR